MDQKFFILCEIDIVLVFSHLFCKFHNVQLSCNSIKLSECQEWEGVRVGWGWGLEDDKNMNMSSQIWKQYGAPVFAAGKWKAVKKGVPSVVVSFGKEQQLRSVRRCMAGKCLHIDRKHPFVVEVWKFLVVTLFDFIFILFDIKFHYEF
jgi:hypothetical protein